MRLLLTRPREDAEGLAAALARDGIEVVIEPLLDIAAIPGARLPLAGAQALLLTSRNGARAAAAATARRDLPVIAVGDSTAALARELGFADVSSAGGDVARLAAKVIAERDPAAGPVVHAAGAATVGNLAGRLQAAGFDCHRVPLYEARPAKRLSAAAAAALATGPLDGVAFFSPRTAATFVRLVGAAALGGSCHSLTAFCLSGAVAAVVTPLPWRRIRIAGHPTQSELLRLLRSEDEEP